MPNLHISLPSSSQSFFTNLTSLPAIQRVYFTDKPSSAFCPLTYTLSLMSTLHVTVWPIAKKYSVSVAAIHQDICTLNEPKVLVSYKQKLYTYPIGFVHLKVAEQTAKESNARSQWSIFLMHVSTTTFKWTNPTAYKDFAHNSQPLVYNKGPFKVKIYRWITRS